MLPPVRKAAALRAMPPRELARHRFALPVRVYYQDTDAGGVVFHARYVNFFERARTEWLRGIGFSVRELAEQEKVLFIVRELHVRYLKPAVLDDELNVTAAIEHLGFVSMTVEQRVLRGAELLVHASVNLACVAADELKPTRVPAQVRSALERSLGASATAQEDA
jgi:acyl-CoA thioester hydrolase